MNHRHVENAPAASSSDHRQTSRWRMDVMPPIKQFDHIGVTVAEFHKMLQEVRDARARIGNA